MNKRPVIYVIGSLKNREFVIALAHSLEQNTGWEFFADWTAPGPDADDFLRDMAKARGWDHIKTLNSYAAKHVCAFDKSHLDRADAALVLLPCGKSCHMELGYMIGQGKPTYVYMPHAPERVDVMYNLAGFVHSELDRIIQQMQVELTQPELPLPRDFAEAAVEAGRADLLAIMRPHQFDKVIADAGFTFHWTWEAVGLAAHRTHPFHEGQEVVLLDYNMSAGGYAGGHAVKVLVDGREQWWSAEYIKELRKG